MKNLKTKMLLILMILLSLFSGIPINGYWDFVYHYEFVDFLGKVETSLRDYFIWLVIIFSHIGILILPFCVEKKYFKKMLLYFPLIFLIGYFILVTPFFFILTPFTLVWLITLNFSKAKKIEVET